MQPIVMQVPREYLLYDKSKVWFLWNTYYSTFVRKRCICRNFMSDTDILMDMFLITQTYYDIGMVLRLGSWIHKPYSIMKHLHN